MATDGKAKGRPAAIQAKSRALAKQYKSDAAKLKKLGVLTSRVNARKDISRATRTKINKFRDVLEGRVTVTRAKPDIRQKYEGILETRGPFLMVPKERAKERSRISRGLVEIERELVRPDGVKYGEEREVILPFKLTDMPSLVERLQTDESLDGLKRGDELFAFRIDGWASKQPFADAKEMGDYISRNYAHLFKPGMAKQVVKYLTFIRYKSQRLDRAPEGEHSYRLRDARRVQKRKVHKRDIERRLDRDADRKAEARKRETDAERAKRLADQRTRSARNRQRKFLED